MEKRPFFRAAMAGLGKYHMGRYGRIGVYRVSQQCGQSVTHNGHDLMRLALIGHRSVNCISQLKRKKIEMHQTRREEVVGAFPT